MKHGFCLTMGSSSALGCDPDRFDLKEADLLLENRFLSSLAELIFSPLSLFLLGDLRFSERLDPDDSEENLSSLSILLDLRLE